MNGLPRPSGWWRSGRTRTADGRSTNLIPIQSTSTWKAGEASQAAGTHSAHCACSTGIRIRRQAVGQLESEMDVDASAELWRVADAWDKAMVANDARAGAGIVIQPPGGSAWVASVT